MENASKALIIAAAILIAIMIISLSVLLFSRIGGKAKEMTDMTEQEIASFNSKITPYLGTAVTGTKVNALLQYCLSYNMAAKSSGETQKYITVSGAATLGENDTSFTRVETGGSTYSVQGKYNKGLITEITITKNS